MMDPSLIYGKAHTLFFVFSGLTTLLVWTSVISLDGYWKDTYFENATNIYPACLNLGGLVALIFYDSFNRFFSFKTQLRYFPFGLAFSFVLLFVVGEFLKKAGHKAGEGLGLDLKSFFFCGMLILEGIFNSILQTSLTRYTFNFSASKISLFNAGTALSGIMFATLYILVAEFTESEPKKNDNTYILWFIGLLFLILIFNFFVFQNYIKNFLDRKDDLTGETDSLREIIDNEERTSSLTSVLRKILAMFFCLILCYSVTMSCFPVLTFAVGSDWFEGEETRLKSASISLLYNIFDCLGKWSYKWLKMKDNVWVYIYSLARLGLVVGYIFATDKTLTNDFFQSKFWGGSLLFMLAFTNGHFTSAAYALASQRCENKSKKTCGYLMTMSLFIGLFYGGMISLFCLEDKSSTQN